MGEEKDIRGEGQGKGAKEDREKAMGRTEDKHRTEGHEWK